MAIHHTVVHTVIAERLPVVHVNVMRASCAVNKSRVLYVANMTMYKKGIVSVLFNACLIFFFEEIAVHLCYRKTGKTSCRLSLLCVPLYLKLIQLILKPYFAINSNHTDSVANLVLISFAINVMPFYTFCPYTNTCFLPVGLFILARVGFSTTSFVIIRHILCRHLSVLSFQAFSDLMYEKHWY